MQLNLLINKYYHRLNDNDLMIYRYLKDHQIINLSIIELSKLLNISKSSILRFCQKLELKGYSELKYILKYENNLNLDNDLLTAVLNTYTNLMNGLKTIKLDDLFTTIHKAKRIYIYGEGMLQASIKKEFKRLFLVANKALFNITGSKEALAAYNIINKDDFCILISVSGENKEVLNFTELLKLKSVKTLSITRNKTNSLSQISSYNLYADSIMVNAKDLNYESLATYFILAEILLLRYLAFIKELKHD